METDIASLVDRLEEQYDANIIFYRNGNEWAIYWIDEYLYDEEFCGEDLTQVLLDAEVFIVQWRKDFIDVSE